MYGLINNALQSMIQSHYGNETWINILQEADVGEEAFVSMQRYEDELTYKLVGATSKVLNEPASTCLELFGRYWATVTAPEAYGVLMDATGSDLVGFLENINALHDRITSTFVGYIPPHFIVKKGENGISLKYESKREGLTPFVVGILYGLAESFQQELTQITVEPCEVDSGETSLIHFSVSDISN